MLSSRFLLSLLLAFSFASSSFASEGVLPARSIASVSAPLFAQETELVSEIDRQADVVFKKFVEDSGTRIPLTTLQKAKRVAIYRLKQMNVLTDILKASGPAPATTILATELLTNFVLAPIATAFGKPAVAGVMLTVPWGLISGFGVFSFQVAKERYKIARGLGRYSLRSLDKLRSVVMGYDIKYRISSVIYQALSEDQAEIEILSKGYKADSSKMPSLLVSELEAMVRASPGGPEYLEAFYMDRLDARFYSAVLLRYINESEPLTAQLVNLVRARTPAVKASDDPLALRRHLLGVDDVMMQIDRSIQQLQKTKAGLKKRVKTGDITKTEAANLKLNAIEELKRLREVRGRLVRHEYAVLLQSQTLLASGGSLKTVAVEASRAQDLVEIALDAHLRPPKASVASVGEARQVPLARVRAAVRAISARPLVCQDLFF